MTIHEALQAADAARGRNEVSDTEMTRWLSYVDRRVIEELIRTHADDLTTRHETLEDFDKRIRLLEEQLAEADDGDDFNPEADRLRDLIIAEKEERDAVMEADYSGADPDTQLYIKAPFEDIYVYYLLARTDLLNRESASHNDHMRQFYTEWKRYANWYNRNSRPTGARDIKW